MKKVVLSIAILLAALASAQAQTKIPPNIQKLLTKNTCLACHNPDNKLVGPAYKEVMKKKKYKPEQIVELIYKPKPSNWAGYPPMAPMSQVPKEEAMEIAKWIVTLK
ncbi:cytochrome C [Lacihabitans sp. LS3-19]|uniref:c-type cytochrome n=1 Tax=Lacihabitans sp. LS3-19 TaxID=2487335 RepID=UPI0020CB86D8|nr:c-type cytochrome [Lacihabitans sp. LS3-19]MCP9767344.1 cytochrome C [Lacihabitans sp. LS3-19]